MSPAAIRELLQRRPFIPFVIRLSSGATYEVRPPECIAIAKTRIVVTDAEEDRGAVWSPMHVTSVDSLQMTRITSGRSAAHHTGAGGSGMRKLSGTSSDGNRSSRS